MGLRLIDTVSSTHENSYWLHLKVNWCSLYNCKNAVNSGLKGLTAKYS